MWINNVKNWEEMFKTYLFHVPSHGITHRQPKWWRSRRWQSRWKSQQWRQCWYYLKEKKEDVKICVDCRCWCIHQSPARVLFCKPVPAILKNNSQPWACSYEILSFWNGGIFLCVTFLKCKTWPTLSRRPTKSAPVSNTVGHIIFHLFHPNWWKLYLNPWRTLSYIQPSCFIGERLGYECDSNTEMNTFVYVS